MSERVGRRANRTAARAGRALASVVLALATAAALPGCAWLDEQQHRLALRPTLSPPGPLPGLRPGDERWLQPVPPTPPPTPGNAAEARQQLALWWLPQPDPAAPALLYLHGTFRHLHQNLPKIDALRDAGFAILAVDYRGWGDSTPIVPSEASIVADAWQAWAELVRRQADPGRRVVFGHSMGGAVAVMLASGLRYGCDYGALALESTFTRMPDVAAAAGFWGRVGAWLTTLEFDAVSRIGRVDAPIWMLHGDADDTVPIDLGRRLRDAAPPGVHWVEVPGGTHSRLHSLAPDTYRQTFHALIEQLPTSPRHCP